MADINKQVGPLAEQDLQEFAAQGKQDAHAYLDESKAKLATWVEQLKNGEIDEDDLRSLLESQTVIGEMRALRAANAGTIPDRKVSGLVLQGGDLDRRDCDRIEGNLNLREAWQTTNDLSDFVGRAEPGETQIA
jgi:hypothetical protein